MDIPHPDQKEIFKLSQRVLEKGDWSFVWNYYHVVDGLVDDDNSHAKARELFGEPWKKTVKYGCSVHLTCDHWSLEQNFNYVGITVHWIDDNFKMHSLPLRMFLHEGGSSAVLLIG